MYVCGKVKFDNAQKSNEALSKTKFEKKLSSPWSKTKINKKPSHAYLRNLNNNSDLLE